MIERDEYPAGVPCWIVLRAQDLEAAKAFYGGVLGWTFTSGGAPGWEEIARKDGRTAAGLGRGEPAWTTYVAVDDVAAATDRVEAAGGTVLVAPADAGAAGRAAELTDPAGARLGLWEAHAHAGAQIVNEPGSWNTSDLGTADRAGAEAFYGAVFGWEATDFDGMTMWRLPGYGDFLAARDPGLRVRHAAPGVPPGFSDVIGWLLPSDGPARWSVTFSHDDPDGAAERAAALGGSVVTPPFDYPPVRAAVLADPEGTTFTVSRYQPESG